MRVVVALVVALAVALAMALAVALAVALVVALAVALVVALAVALVVGGGTGGGTKTHTRGVKPWKKARRPSLAVWVRYLVVKTSDKRRSHFVFGRVFIIHNARAGTSEVIF